VSTVSLEAPVSTPVCLFERGAACLTSATQKWTPVTQREQVAASTLYQLYRYPLSEHQAESGARSVETDEVVLIVYAMVNTASVLDLDRDMSMIQALKAQGLTVYLMEWEEPQVQQSSIGMSEYLQRSLHHCVMQIRQDCKLDKINLMGVCQGGVFALCYAKLYPEYIRSVIPLVTPINCHTQYDTLSTLARHMDFESLLMPGINIPGQLLAQVFLSLKPMTLSIMKYIEISERLNAAKDNTELSRKFMAMEQWIEETPDQPALFFKEFVESVYQQNALYKGELLILGEKIDLRQMEIPVLNIYASNDHLVPPDSSKALAELVPEAYYQSLEVRTGHIGMFVSRKSLKQVPQAIADFIRQP